MRRGASLQKSQLLEGLLLHALLDGLHLLVSQRQAGQSAEVRARARQEDRRALGGAERQHLNSQNGVYEYRVVTVSERNATCPRESWPAWRAAMDAWRLAAAGIEAPPNEAENWPLICAPVSFVKLSFAESELFLSRLSLRACFPKRARYFE